MAISNVLFLRLPDGAAQIIKRYGPGIDQITWSKNFEDGKKHNLLKKFQEKHKILGEIVMNDEDVLIVHCW